MPDRTAMKAARDALRWQAKARSAFWNGRIVKRYGVFIFLGIVAAVFVVVQLVSP